MRSRYSASSLLPEQRLILDACRSHFVQIDLRLSLTRADAGHAIRLARDLGVLGLTSSAIRTQSPEAKWSQAWMENFGRNMMLAGALGEWVAVFGRRGIEPIAFKGIALGRIAFNHFSMRDSCDLDLIVPFDAFHAAVEVLQQHGAREVDPSRTVPPVRLGAMTFEVEGDHTYTIDLHAGWVPRWGYLSGRIIPEHELTTIGIQGFEVRTLGPRLMHIHAVSHFFQHYFSLKTLMDVAFTRSYIRKLGLEEDCRTLAAEMGTGLDTEMDRAETIVDEFLARACSRATPWGQGTPALLASPSTQKISRMTWSGLRALRSRRDQGRLKSVAATLWPPQRETSGSRVVRLVRIAARTCLGLTELLFPRLATRSAWRRAPTDR